MVGWLAGWLLLHINHCRVFNEKSSLNIDIRYKWIVYGFWDNIFKRTEDIFGTQ